MISRCDEIQIHLPDETIESTICYKWSVWTKLGHNMPLNGWTSWKAGVVKDGLPRKQLQNKSLQYF